VFYYLVQDLKCLIFALIALHFKVGDAVGAHVDRSSPFDRVVYFSAMQPPVKREIQRTCAILVRTSPWLHHQ
jgi:hypothetical protein